jgi:hypothetical protein
MTKIIAPLLLVLLSVDANAYQSQAGSYGKEARQGQAPAQQPRIALRAAPSEQSTNGNERDASQLWPKFLDRLIDPVTWFTGLLFLVGLWQWKAMKAGLAQTRESNAATRKSNEIAERALMLNARSWLVAQIEPPSDWKSETSCINVTVRNVGRIPAVIRRYGCEFIYGGISRPEDEDLGMPYRHSMGGDIVPNDAAPLSFQVRIDGPNEGLKDAAFSCTSEWNIVM